MSSNEIPPLIDLPSWAEELFEPYRYKVLYGGRGGAKSHTIAKILLIEAARKRHRVLCTRELQVSIRDSVHKLLSDQISELGLDDKYEIQRTQILGRNGSEFIFAGLAHNINKIKSTEGVTRCWVEEAELVSEHSWSVLIPTIRKEDSEIFISFNSDQATDPTYKRFIETTPPNSKVIKVGWEENPWFPETLRIEKDYLYRVDPTSADHVWGGNTRTESKAQVLHGKVSIAPFEPHATWDGPYQGVDWGFAVDPTTLVRCWIRHVEEGDLKLSELFIEYEAYGIGVDINKTPALFDTVPNARKYVTRADNARPETISHMRQNGYGMMVPAVKGPGSIEDGIMHLRSFSKIVIHPRCIHTIQESRDYKYKVDKLTGAILPVPIDKNNNCVDSLRYALEPVMKKKKITYDYISASKKSKPVMNKKSGGFRSRTGGVL